MKTNKNGFYNEVEDKYLRWKLRKEKIFRIGGRILFWGFLIIVVLSILIGIIVGSLNYKNFLPKDVQSFFHLQVLNDQKVGGILQDIINAILSAILIFLWPIIWLFAALTYVMQLIFNWAGGAGLINLFLKSTGLVTQISVVAVASVAFLAICLVVRAVKIAHNKEGDIGHAMAKATPGIVFGSITAIVLIPVLFLFINGVVMTILSVLINNGNMNMATLVWNASFGDGSQHLTEFADIPTSGFTVVNYIWNNDFNIGICLIGWIGTTVLMGIYTWYVIGLIFNIIFLYVLLFPAAAKWPNDEGGSVYAVRDEIVGNFVNLFSLYFIFTLFTVMIAGINGIELSISGTDPTGLLPGVIVIILLLSGGLAAWKMPKKIPGLFAAKGDTSYYKNDLPGSKAAQEKAKDLNSEKNPLSKENREERKDFKESHDGMDKKEWEKSDGGIAEKAKVDAKKVADSKIASGIRSGKSPTEAVKLGKPIGKKN